MKVYIPSVSLKGTKEIYCFLRDYILPSLADNWDMERWRPGLERSLARLHCFWDIKGCYRWSEVEHLGKD